VTVLNSSLNLHFQCSVVYPMYTEFNVIVTYGPLLILYLSLQRGL